MTSCDLCNACTDYSRCHTSRGLGRRDMFESHQKAPQKPHICGCSNKTRPCITCLLMTRWTLADVRILERVRHDYFQIDVANQRSALVILLGTVSIQTESSYQQTNFCMVIICYGIWWKRNTNPQCSKGIYAAVPVIECLVASTPRETAYFGDSADIRA